MSANTSARRESRNGLSPSEVDAYVYPGGLVDLNSDVWHFKGCGINLRCDRLRPDIAEVGWPLLREELRKDVFKLGTIQIHHLKFIWAGQLLGTEVPHIQTATLEGVQRAWRSYEGTHTKRLYARAGLIQLFTELVRLAETDRKLDRQHMLSIAVWLRMEVKFPRERVRAEFLSEADLEEVLLGCLLDIKAGTDLSATQIDAALRNSGPGDEAVCKTIYHWGSALMTLVMAFTGLRPQSIERLETGEWLQIRPGVLAIIWRHGKKGEENLVLTDAIIGRWLDEFVQRTTEIRRALQTKRAFLIHSAQNEWKILKSDQVRECMHRFIRRHDILRHGEPLNLTPTMLRRTYATQQLYKGRNIWLTRAQLGHSSIKNTERYTQFDRYEHPAQVRNALDVWGRQALNLWQQPVLPEPLTPTEHASLFASEGGCCQDCHESASMQKELPPCSSCKYLVTGDEFGEAWDDELVRRQERLKELESLAVESPELQREREELGRFLENYRRVKAGRSQ